MSTIQRYVLLAVLLATKSSVLDAVSRPDLGVMIGGWGGHRGKALYWLIDNGYVREFHREYMKTCYYSPTERALRHFEPALRHISVTSLYSDVS